MIFAARRKHQRWDLEALETATRAALHHAGATLLEQLLTAPVEAAPKILLTVLGAVEIERSYYLCPACHQGQLPFDRELDVENTHYSPGCAAGSRRWAASRRSKVGARNCSCEPVWTSPPKPSVPMVAAETAGRAGKSDSERARTREVKLGCVFTQPECEQDGRPVREEASTSYSGSDRGRRAV